jgi:branched-chain amino acid transport system permease protein
MVVVGGVASILGSIIGAVFMTILPEVIRIVKDYLPKVLLQQQGLEAIIYGAILILFISFEPGGLFGRWLRIKEYWRTYPLGKKVKRKKVMVSSARKI